MIMTENRAIIFFPPGIGAMRPALFFFIGLAIALPAPDGEAARASGRHAWCGTERSGARDAVWAHREQRDRRGPEARSLRGAFDVGEIAVLLDEGDLALVANPMDLQKKGVRFSPAGSGYSVSRVDLPLEPDAGSPLTLADDASQSVALGFAFPFYGSTYAQAFVNSDGNLTFGGKDDASTARNVGRLVNGPPRVAPLLADFNAEEGGRISMMSLPDHVTVTWRAVPQFERFDKNTFQVTLWADGRIDFVYDQELSSDIEEGATGIAPGSGRAGLTAVDFSAAAGVAGGAGALAESFRQEDGLDTVAVARKFYATHPDRYQQLVIYTSRRLVSSNTFSYEQTVANADAGIGVGIESRSAEYGSAGRLESFITMDAISKYPDDLALRFLGEDSALSVLAHEVGHRWLVNALFRDGAADSHDLLGRDEVHWSFFVDTDGSHLEGNDIEPQSDGSFRTTGASLRYSAIDQYLMGMRDASEVPPFFFVRNPAGVLDTDPGREPRTGVTFTGTRKDVSIGDVVSALGARRPAGAPWTAPFRQAFVYVSVGGPPDPAALAKIERIRAAWPAFFLMSTEGRGTVDPTLD
jgi:hypothetical protein